MFNFIDYYIGGEKNDKELQQIFNNLQIQQARLNILRNQTHCYSVVNFKNLIKKFELGKIIFLDQLRNKQSKCINFIMPKFTV